VQVSKCHGRLDREHLKNRTAVLTSEEIQDRADFALPAEKMPPGPGEARALEQRSDVHLEQSIERGVGLHRNESSSNPASGDLAHPTAIDKIEQILLSDLRPCSRLRGSRQGEEATTVGFRYPLRLIALEKVNLDDEQG
jgi:hypothetical protein